MSAVDQLRAKSPDELRQELTGLRREHFNLRVQKAVQQLNKPSELRRVRREIARALTVLREKEIAQFTQTGKALEFARIQAAPKLASAEAEVSPEIAAAAAAGAVEQAEQEKQESQESPKPKAAKKSKAAKAGDDAPKSAKEDESESAESAKAKSAKSAKAKSEESGAKSASKQKQERA